MKKKLLLAKGNEPTAMWSGSVHVNYSCLSDSVRLTSGCIISVRENP